MSFSEISTALNLHEQRFAGLLWRFGLRSDTRDAFQLRDIVLEFPLHSRNVLLIHLGKTLVSATVQCRLVEPSERRIKHGFISVHLSRQTNNQVNGFQFTHETEGGRIMNNADMKLQQLLEALFVQQGNILDTESLCAIPGKRVWSIRVNVCILNDAGNTTDAVCWAVVCGLKRFRRPDMTIQGNDVIVHSAYDREPVALNLHSSPYMFSFAVTSLKDSAGLSLGNKGVGDEESNLDLDNEVNSMDIIVDPTTTELVSSSALINIAVNTDGKICYVGKSHGKNDISYSIVKKCINAAKQLSQSLILKFDEEIKKHEVKRKKAVELQFLWARERQGLTASITNNDENPNEVN